MAMTHERLAVSSGLHTSLTNYRFSGSPNLQNPQPTTSLLDIEILTFRNLTWKPEIIRVEEEHHFSNVLFPVFHVSFLWSMVLSIFYLHPDPWVWC